MTPLRMRLPNSVRRLDDAELEATAVVGSLAGHPLPELVRGLSGCLEGYLTASRMGVSISRVVRAMHLMLFTDTSDVNCPQARPFLTSEARESAPACSPDSRWISFVREGELWVASYPGPGTSYQVSPGGANSKEVLLLRDDFPTGYLPRRSRSKRAISWKH